MKKILTIGLLSFSLAACSGQPEDNNNNNNNVDAEKEVKVTETLPAGSSDIKEVQSVESSTQVETKQEQKDESISNDDSTNQEIVEPEKQQLGNSFVAKKGVFYGLADNKSAEFQVDGESIVYLFSDEVFEKLNNMEYEANVEFTYFVNEAGQNVINDIKKI